jgi:hypothetical protein
MIAIILIIVLALAFVLQFLTGGFPVSFFAFPLNLICMLLWLLIMLGLWKTLRKSLFIRYMLSPNATFSSILLVMAACLFMGFTGWRSIAVSWVFVALLLYLQTVLLFVLLRGWRDATPTGARLGSVRWRFVLLHGGLMLMIASAFWGRPDSQTMRMKIHEGSAAVEVYRMDGTPTFLDYEVELKDFRMEKYETDVPSDFSADVLVDGKPVTLRVNHPYSVNLSEQIYLSGYDVAAGADSDYCILQVVKEPWKYGIVAGVVLTLLGAMLLFIAGPKKKYRDLD